MEKSNLLLTLPGGLRNIFWRRLSMGDLDVVEDMVCDCFVKQEPLNVAVGLTVEDALTGIVPLCKTVIQDGNSICAYEPNADRICGISINSGPHSVQQPTNNSLDVTAVTHKLNKIHTALEFIGGGPDKALSMRAGNAKFMKCDILVVHEDYGRMGIGEAICKKTWEIAKEKGCKFVFAECTSTFTTNIFKKNGAETLREVVYSEYTDPISGEKVFENCPEPHKIGTLMCKEL